MQQTQPENLILSTNDSISVGLQSSKQDTGRTKRYSSQRQRNTEQTPPENAQFFPPEIPKGKFL
jgi:hypothetical protein